jgi:hypothetical protein
MAWMGFAVGWLDVCCLVASQWRLVGDPASAVAEAVVRSGACLWELESVPASAVVGAVAGTLSLGFEVSAAAVGWQVGSGVVVAWSFAKGVGAVELEGDIVVVDAAAKTVRLAPLDVGGREDAPEEAGRVGSL